MPTADGDIIETAINWDHDTGDISISTRRKGVESKLRRLGLKPIRAAGDGYVTFWTHDKDLKISFRGPKKMSEEHKAKIRDAKKRRQTSLQTDYEPQD